MKKLLVLLLVPLLLAAGCGKKELPPPTAEVRMETESENFMLADGKTQALHYSCTLPVPTPRR